MAKDIVGCSYEGAHLIGIYLGKSDIEAIRIKAPTTLAEMGTPEARIVLANAVLEETSTLRSFIASCLVNQVYKGEQKGGTG